MQNVSIMVAVPPNVKGDTVKMSRKGGVWNEMKRTISWFVEELTPGKAMELQLHFECMSDSSSSADSSNEQPQLTQKQMPKFPVLVRADCPSSLFSSIEIISDYSSGSNEPAKLDLARSGRLLHRKV